MNTILNFLDLLKRFVDLIISKSFNVGDVLNHLSNENNLDLVLKSTNFQTKIDSTVSSDSSNQILYRDDDRITGNEEVIKTEDRYGLQLNYILDSQIKISWISTKKLNLLLLQDNLKAAKAFSNKGYREREVLENWQKATEIPERIYFISFGEQISCQKLEDKKALFGVKSIPFNLQAAFNVKFKEFHKEFPNGIQKKDDDKFYCSAFGRWCGGPEVNVNRNDYDWSGSWWFLVSLCF